MFALPFGGVFGLRIRTSHDIISPSMRDGELHNMPMIDRCNRRPQFEFSITRSRTISLVDRCGRSVTYAYDWCPFPPPELWQDGLPRLRLDVDDPRIRQAR
jgi:hypothetical protein